MKRILKRSGHWIWIFILTDGIFIFVTWMANPDSLKYMLPFLLLFSLIAVITGEMLDRKQKEKDKEAVSAFLETSDEKAADKLADYFNDDQTAEEAIREYMRAIHLVKDTGSRMNDYQEYIEAWVHEVKTPISLMELMLENHKDEMSSYVYQRIRYAEHQLMEDAERILYYSRLDAEHPDFRLETFSLSECVTEKIEEYRPFCLEKGIDLKYDLEPVKVVSDRRIASFMFSQLMSNAVKYADTDKGRIIISVVRKGDNIILDICNNGTGVLPEDRPFLFDKGFTGSHPDRQKATGMGLYLVRKYAEKLGITVQLDEEIPFAKGFGTALIFHL